MENNFFKKRILKSELFPLFIVLIVIVAVFTAIKPAYITNMDNLRGMLNSMSLTGMLAIGMGCLLIGGGIDLSAGATGMFGGIMAATFIQRGVPWGVALILAMLIGAVIGMVNAFLVNGLNIMGFIATIGVSMALEGLANIVTDAHNVSVNNTSYFSTFSASLFGVLPVPFLIMLALFIIYGLILSRTRAGRIVYMCGGNPTAAKTCGLNPKKVSTILYINSGMLAALAGVILTARVHSASPTAVIGQEFSAITAAVLGGVAFLGGSGNMVGCFIGVLLLTSFTNGLTFVGLGAYWTVIARGMLLVFALTIDFINQRTHERRMKAV